MRFSCLTTSTIVIICLISITFAKEPNKKEKGGYGYQVNNYGYGPADLLKQNGTQRLLKVLKSHGVAFLFAIVGSDTYFILGEAAKQGLRVVNVRHENVGVYAAQGVGKMTGRPGVVVVTAGPGTTNTVSGALNAKEEQVPLIIIGGAAAESEIGTAALHESDGISIMTPVCKQVFAVDSVSQVIPTLKRAFQVAMSDTPGPVYIQVRKNALFEPEPYESHIELNTTKCLDGGGLNPRHSEYQQSDYSRRDEYYERRGAVYEDLDLNPLPVTFPVASECEIETSIGILANAIRPLIVIGSLATSLPKELMKLRSSLESIGIPVYLEKTAKGLLDKDNKLLMGFGLQNLLRSADVVILAGIECDFWFRFGLDLPSDGKIITVGRNPKTLMTNSPRVWFPRQVVVGDPILYLIGLEAKIREAQLSFTSDGDQLWLQTCRDISDQEENTLRAMAERPARYHLNPLKLLFALDQHAPPNTIFIGETGDFASAADRIIRGRFPLSVVSAGKNANCGIGIGIALGVKLARPDSPVYVIVGDGSVGYHMMDFDSYVRHYVPVVVWVGNDGRWSMPGNHELEDLGTLDGSLLAHTNYQNVAIALGARGTILDSRNAENVEDEICKIIEDTGKSNLPFLANMLIGKSEYRDVDPYP